MFTHILCPTDLKERALIALKKAVQIAHQFNSKITMLNVHDEFINKEEREMLRVSFESMKDKYAQVAIESREQMRVSIRQRPDIAEPPVIQVCVSPVMSVVSEPPIVKWGKG